MKINEISEEKIRELAAAEEIGENQLRAGVSSGEIVILRSPRGTLLAVGAGCYIKVNANIGTSPGHESMERELEKLRAAEEAGAHAVMDLSTGGDLVAVRRAIIEESTVPVGSVPIYGAAVSALRNHGDARKMSEAQMWEAVESEAASGVSFMTIHTGVSEQIVHELSKDDRLINVVSRGGSLTACWIKQNRRENPFLEDFPRLLEIARRYDVVLSLGDGMRPGAIADSTDRHQLRELFTLGEQAKAAREAGVGVVIEGPGHIPMHEVALNVQAAKKITGGAPLYLLGPLVTDVAPGYDHITGAIGGAIAGAAGADFLCYVTPAEHLSLPDMEDVREGVFASRIAAHAADLARGRKKAAAWDLAFSKARRDRDWAAQVRMSLNPARVTAAAPDKKAGEVCTMCGDYCAMIFSEQLGGKKPERE